MGIKILKQSPLYGKRILITGHTGFKGSWLARYLARYDVELFGLSLEANPGSMHCRLNPSIYAQEFIQDIRNKSQLAKTLENLRPNYIFHLAAQPLVIASYENPLATFDTNVMGTANLLDSLMKIDSVSTVIVATTDKVYQNLENGQKYKELDALQGVDPYSASKVGTEAVVRAWQNLAGQTNGMSITSVRAGNVIGGGDFAENRLLPDIVRSYINQEPLVVRNPGSTRPWQHVLDPIIGYVAAAERSVLSSRFPAFNFGPTDSSLSVREVVEIAKSTLEFQEEFVETLNSPRHEASQLDLDSSHAREVLAWTNRWTQENAVLGTINWWKSVLTKDLTADEATKIDLDYAINYPID